MNSFVRSKESDSPFVSEYNRDTHWQSVGGVGEFGGLVGQEGEEEGRRGRLAVQGSMKGQMSSREQAHTTIRCNLSALHSFTSSWRIL